MKFPEFTKRIASIGGPIGDERFEDGSLAAIEIARSGDIFAGRISGEFVFKADGVADMKGSLARVQRYFQVNIGRTGSEGLLMPRLEAVVCGLRWRRNKEQQAEENRKAPGHAVTRNIVGENRLGCMPGMFSS